LHDRQLLGEQDEAAFLVEPKCCKVVDLGINRHRRRPPTSRPHLSIDDQSAADTSSLCCRVDSEPLEKTRLSCPAGDRVADRCVVRLVDGNAKTVGRRGVHGVADRCRIEPPAGLEGLAIEEGESCEFAVGPSSKVDVTGTARCRRCCPLGRSRGEPRRQWGAQERKRLHSNEPDGVVTAARRRVQSTTADMGVTHPAQLVQPRSEQRRRHVTALIDGHEVGDRRFAGPWSDTCRVACSTKDLGVRALGRRIGFGHRFTTVASVR